MIKQFFTTYALRIAALVTVFAVGACLWLYADLATTKAKLDKAQAIVDAQTRAIEALDRIDALEARLRREVRDAARRIEEAEGSQDEIPPEVGAAFIANSDRMLSYRGNPRAVEELHVPR